MAKLRVLVCGFGFMGQTHAASLLRIPEVELAGLVNRGDPVQSLLNTKGNLETETISVEETGKIPHYRSLDEALQNARADAVVISLPTQLHCSAVMQVLQAGLHVFVEKPFSLYPAECAEMVACAREHQRILAVGYVVRATKGYLYLKETLDSGRLGKLKLLKMTRVTGVPNWGKWKDPETLKASGGGLFDLLSHDVDFIRFCLGNPSRIESFSGLGGGQFRLISSVLRYPEADAVVEGGFVTPSEYAFHANYTAFFEKGTLESSGDGGKLTEYRNGEAPLELSFQSDNPYLTEMEGFIRAVRTGDLAGICSGDDARETIECCTQIAKDLSYPLPE